MEGGLKWQSIGVSQKDMDFISSMKLSRETVLAIFHVPPAMVGIFDHAPQFNTKEQQRIFWQTCILPKQNNMWETFTEFLLSEYDRTDSLYFDKDNSSVSALKEDEVQRAQAAKIYADIGFSKQELIEGLGLPFSVETSKVKKTIKKKTNKKF